MRLLFLFFFLLLPIASAMSMGISPDVVYLDRTGKGAFWLLNPNEEDMRYTLSSNAELSRIQGIILAEDRVRIGIRSVEDGFITAEFYTEHSDDLLVIPQLRIPVKIYEVSMSEGILMSVFVVILGIALIGLTYFFLISSGLRLR